jgi:hypothetical protein
LAYLIGKEKEGKTILIRVKERRLGGGNEGIVHPSGVRKGHLD